MCNFNVFTYCNTQAHVTLVHYVIRSVQLSRGVRRDSSAVNLDDGDGDDGGDNDDDDDDSRIF